MWNGPCIVDLPERPRRRLAHPGVGVLFQRLRERCNGPGILEGTERIHRRNAHRGVGVAERLDQRLNGARRLFAHWCGRTSHDGPGGRRYLRGRRRGLRRLF
jgi:hypothetical protein